MRSALCAVHGRTGRTAGWLTIPHAEARQRQVCAHARGRPCVLVPCPPLWALQALPSSCQVAHVRRKPRAQRAPCPTRPPALHTLHSARPSVGQPKTAPLHFLLFFSPSLARSLSRGRAGEGDRLRLPLRPLPSRSRSRSRSRLLSRSRSRFSPARSFSRPLSRSFSRSRSFSLSPLSQARSRDSTSVGRRAETQQRARPGAQGLALRRGTGTEGGATCTRTRARTHSTQTHTHTHARHPPP